MKKIFFIALLLLAGKGLLAQTTYYRGEWTKAGTAELFTGLFAITVHPDGSVTGDLLWKYMACDSTDDFQLANYKNKKGRTAIEMIEGSYDAAKHQFDFTGKDKIDPWEVIGQDVYTLKLSADKKLLYGVSAANGTNKGLFYGILTDANKARAEMASVRSLLKKKMN